MSFGGLKVENKCHYYRSLLSFITIVHYYCSLLSFITIIHYYHSLLSSITIIHYYHSLHSLLSFITTKFPKQSMCSVFNTYWHVSQILIFHQIWKLMTIPIINPCLYYNYFLSVCTWNSTLLINNAKSCNLNGRISIQ